MDPLSCDEIVEPRAKPKPRAVNADRLHKAVEALAIVPSNRRISLLARKIYNVMLFHAQRQGAERIIYRVPLRDVVRSLEFNSNNTEVIKAHLREMVTTKVEWQAPTVTEGQRWSVSALISHADLISNRGEVTIEWSYAPNIRQQLLNPDRYAQISLLYSVTMRSYAAMALYEICSRYVNNPSKVTARQTWIWWHPVLTGAPTGEASNAKVEYKYFKRDVLKPAIAEINSVTDLSVQLIEHKEGRAVNAIQFGVTKAVQPSLPLERAPEPIDLSVIGEAISLGVQQDRAESMLAKHGSSALAAGLKQLATRKARAYLEPVKSPAGFLAAIIREDTRTHERKPISQQRVVINEGVQINEALTREMLVDRYCNLQRANASALFRELSEAERVNWIAKFEESEKAKLSPIHINHLKRTGIESVIVKPLFTNFFARETWGKEWDQPSDSDLLRLAMTR
jgi:hypothetical protein